jgi:NitT/TauT family transport system ATP-binding protein
LDWRSSLSNVEVPLEIMGHPIAERRARARAMLAVVGLRGFEDRYPWQLSGGMQQRVAIARALVYQPPVLLMDEPFGALDAITRENLQIELTDLWSRTDATVFFITHSIAEAVFLSDRVAIMTPRPGQIRDIVRIPLARPRDKATRRSFAFFELVDEVRSRLEASGDLDSGSRSMDADLEG